MTISPKTTLYSNVRWLDLQRYYELLAVLVERNLKGRYRGSFLGIYWSMLNPLIMTGIYTAIFSKLFVTNPQFQHIYNGSYVKFALSAFSGLIVINFFNASTTQALSSVVSNGSLLNKIRLPMSIFPISMVVANVFQFVMGALPLLAIVTLRSSENLVYGLINILALIFPLLALTLVSTGVGFIVSTLYVFFRDLPYFYEIVSFVIWMTSPIFYPEEIAPEQVRVFLSLNPLIPVIKCIRQISLHGTFPDLELMIRTLLSSLIILFLGWICFRRWQRDFMDLL
jgi:ABC-type polysaccharide/polyol phosphate export permease